ncbi:MAG TPA: glycosyltransferase family 4 protein [Bacteroidia bacterium]|nr:glycosyltransferase family 4 protein [Bacteroidia bacterium]
MKIVFVVEHFYPYVGGAEELFLSLTTALAEAGHEIVVITTKFNSAVPIRETYQKVKIIRINCFNRFLFTVFSIPTIITEARTADFIHTTSYNSAIPSFIAGKICSKKTLITFHEVWGDLWMKLPFTPRYQLRAFKLFEQLILKLPFYKYIAVSAYTRQSLINHGIRSDKIVLIYNGLDAAKLRQFQHHSPEEFAYCFFGRLGISKGIELLLEASKKFIAAHPQARLKLIIPTYPEKLFKKVMRKIMKSGIQKNIELFHNLTKEQLFDEVASSSCVVIPSHSEGFCFVAVESALINVPVISSGLGSLKEVVSGHFLEMAEQSAEGLFNALETAYSGKWEYKNPLSFNLNKSVDEYLKLYGSV